MKARQRFTPKYWVGHIVDSDDIMKHTMHKTKFKAERMVGEIYEGWEGDPNIEVILIEVKMV